MEILKIIVKKAKDILKNDIFLMPLPKFKILNYENKTSIIIGGTKGIGSVITKKLKDRAIKVLFFKKY